VSIATEYAHSHPRAARSIGAGAMVAVAGVGTLHAFSSLFAVAILLGTVKAAYSAVQIALMIAAVRGAIQTVAKLRRTGWTVIRHADATKQKLISAVGQPSPARLRLRRPRPTENRVTHLLIPPFRLTNCSTGSEFSLSAAA
jgi:hypothetical protein